MTVDVPIADSSGPEPAASTAAGAGAPATESSPASQCIDPLTGLPGADFWRIVLATEDARLTRYGGRATVVFVEVAHFDEVRLTWGVDVADLVLLSMGRAIRASARASDYAAWLDAARFGLILPETDEIAAINFVERVRARCERYLRGAGAGVRLVFGWSSPKGAMTLADAAMRADQRLRHEAAEARP